jgi:hypothetical protein
VTFKCFDAFIVDFTGSLSTTDHARTDELARRWRTGALPESSWVAVARRLVVRQTLLSINHKLSPLRRRTGRIRD